jgi:hypothetical protein
MMFRDGTIRLDDVENRDEAFAHVLAFSGLYWRANI